MTLSTLPKKRPHEHLLILQDPSGHSREYLLPENKTLTFGRMDCRFKIEPYSIELKDQSLPEGVCGEFLIQNEKIMFKILNQSKNVPSAEYAGLTIREAELPFISQIKFGSSLFSFSKKNYQSSQWIPEIPKSVKPWKTKSESGAQLLIQTNKVAKTPLSVYLSGETGTGKDLLAHLIHAWSDCASGPFVALNCGAISLSLVESELFGHVKGAFTGADRPRTGAFLKAHNGTLFLDEVGNLPPEIQVKLLRFLEDGEIRPVGSDTVLHSKVRLICATHLPLRQLVEEGKFRQDLYFRIASVTLKIPSLRDRPEDIEMLSIETAKKLGKEIPPKTLLKLKAYRWPGNVRELQHSVERACGLSSSFDSLLSEECFEWEPLQKSNQSSNALEFDGILKIEDMEKILLLKALRLAKGHRGEAAKILGVARSTVFDMLKRHKIMGPRMLEKMNAAPSSYSHPYTIAL